MLRQSKELRLGAPGRLHPLQPALVGDLWHGYGRYQTAADPLVPRDASIELGRRLGVSYPTAWYLHKRLRHAMTERGARHVLGAAHRARSWRGAGAYADTTRSGRTRPAGGRVRSPRFPAWCSSSDASRGTSGSAAVWYRP